MTEPILQVQDLHVQFVRKNLWGRPAQVLHAVNGVDLTIGPGESVGLVGESGSGKSTVARAITSLVPVESGRIDVGGQDILKARGRDLQRLRRRFQMVFQDPYSSLDPSMSIEASLLEPLTVHHLAKDNAARTRAAGSLEAVGLRQSDLGKYPHEFSGGQRQRIAIARAMITEPELLILDEAVSALDVSTRAQVLQLLSDLRRDRGLAFLFIGHDLAIVEKMSERIAVMYMGSVVEIGSARQVIHHARHPYTQSLLDSIPRGLGKRERTAENRALLRTEPPDPWDLPAGCPFATRCPKVTDICQVVDPPKVEVALGQTVLCHHVERTDDNNDDDRAMPVETEV